MTLVDTNVLLNAINRDAAQGDVCRCALEQLVTGTETWVVSWMNIYEFLRVATHPAIFAKPLTMEAGRSLISELISRPNCLLPCETPLHAEVMGQCLNESPRISGNRVHDFHIAVLMREHGISTILTLDKDFHAFPWVTVEHPARRVAGGTKN